jgi:hypothetical protein
VLRGSRFRQLTRGVYITRDSEATYELQVRAALLYLPAPALATSITGLWLYGVEVGTPLPLRFVTTHPHPVRRDGLKVTRSTTLPAHHGPVASAEHCWLAAAAELDLVELVTAGDWLLRLNKVSLPGLRAYAQSPSARYRARARTALDLVCERVESPRESRLRLCLVLAGLPTPDCNVTIGDQERPYGRVDLAYLVFKVIVEYEGDQHRTERYQWNRDIERQEDFVRGGWVLIRVTADRLRWPHEVVLRVFAALREAGYTGPPPVFSATWSRLFE